MRIHSATTISSSLLETFPLMYARVAFFKDTLHNRLIISPPQVPMHLPPP